MNRKPHRNVLVVVAGSVLALAAGCDSTTDTATDPPRPTTVTVTPANVEMTELGDTARLGVEVLDQYGNSMTGVSVTWNSSDITVARVRSGVVTALGEGETTIVASVGDVQGTSRITVRNPERAALIAFYQATDGPNWQNNEGWLTDLPLGAWYGVRTDDDRRVVRIELRGVVHPSGVTRHGLAGPIPPELGSLSRLAILDLGLNELTGQLPPELGGLSELWRLLLDDNDLTGPIPVEFGNLTGLWMLNLRDNRLTGPIPASLGGHLYLRNLDLGNNNLTGSIPAEFGVFRRLRTLDLSQNRLTGSIPAGLGNLRLLSLRLNENELTGSIPDQLGLSERLDTLVLSDNDLTGPIPAQFESLDSLSWLDLGNNELTGPIPSELGDLDSLRFLDLAGNKLTGSVPTELGNLANLTVLYLDDNVLTGPLPAEFGGLSRLTRLFLDNNDLEGPVPPGLGLIWRLEELGLTNNSRMNGALSGDLTGLGRLRTLVAGGTDLCAPSDAAFQAWLEGVPKRRLRTCARDLPMAYVTQAVQSREFPVPLIAGEGALLRIFPTARRASSVAIPASRVRFYLDGRETHVETVPGKSSHIPTEVIEGDLSQSVNLDIDGSLVQPGLEVVIEVDPDRTLAPELGVQTRIPATGRLAVEVRHMPLFDLTLIPFLWSEDPDSAIVALIDGIAEDPGNHEMLWGTRTLLPVGDLEVTAHQPVLTSTNNGYELLYETRAIRAMEGEAGHYRGMMTGAVTGTGGVAHLPGWASFGHPDLSTMEIEFGFNMSLQSAPCGDPENPDPTFPYRDGSIGAWGYDTRDGGALMSPSTPDLMSGCEPGWISDYHFTNALRYRLTEENRAGRSRAASPTRSLLLWGGVDSDGLPFLEPILVVDVPPALPETAGDHEITGRAATGHELFSLRFSMPEVAHGDGSSSFAFVLPVGPGWEKDLSRVTLSGPGGSVELDGESDRAVAILRDPRTGQIRGVLRDLPDAVLTRDDAIAAVSAGRGLEVLFSRGLPGPEVWRR